MVKTSLYNCHFVVQTQNHMASEGWLIITIYNLIQKWDMAYAKYDVYPTPVLEFISMFKKTWISALTTKQQPRHQPVTDCFYGTVIGSFENWNIIKL